MRLVTTSEMKAIDTWAMRKLGMPGTVLMENAGRGCVDVLEHYFKLEGQRVLVVCGKGNNGGDGFVVARHLANRRALARVGLLGRARELKGDARRYCRLVDRAGIRITEVVRPNVLQNLIATFHPDVIVDAIFGTGFTGVPGALYRRAFDLLNDSDAFILSIDIPSGVNGDDGRIYKTCVVADATATMCLPKRGNLLFPGRDCGGDLHTVDIGIPYALIEEGPVQVTEPEAVRAWLPFRRADGNKGTFGQILIVAGARGFSGAAAMAAHAALRMGAGLVRLAAPRGIIEVLEARPPEAVKIPLSQTADETIDPGALSTLRPLLKTCDVIVVGPGLTTHPGTVEFLRRLLPLIRVPCIIDADAINIIAQDPSILKKLRAPVMMTPHPGELSRLIRQPPAAINQARIDIALEQARAYGCVLALKGAPTVVADPHGRAYVNPTGNSGLATAGSGDVLVGMIGGLVAQGQSLLHAGAAGVYLHGLCADRLMVDSNEYSLTATDLIGEIPGAINHLLKSEAAP